MGLTVAPRPARPDWLPLAEFPFESRHLAVDGHLIHHVDEGAGPTLLLVHAGPAWSFVFRDLIVRLRDQFRCVALDLPGSGLSIAGPEYRPSLEAASHVLEAFIDALDLRDLTLVVHDLGGPVALGVAARRPDLVVGLAVTESFAWPLPEENPAIARALRLIGGRVFDTLNATTDLLARVTAGGHGAGRHLTTAGRRAFRGPYRDRRVRRRAVAMLRDALGGEAHLRTADQALRTVLRDLPVLLVFGRRSPAVKGGFTTGWRARYPDAPLLLVDGAHHFPMADDPDAVADAIASWWEASVGGPPVAAALPGTGTAH
jgi:haloalkane dehalogenase